ncbi:adenosylmethionine--8-amino-7-oxononanoate transaminase [Limnobaculum zhutongyuii]|uniref:Adenosylmethionine-8-amino-7-oxononanoate aminotransferase n=1 Tax=Limnobaculum zhutongyuii TaxID=2498113 RepID=A0A411WI48_9GAMM|nr:adenosylmethionine--8-amino-7-oxononanoate transaminase [Limnobaculum zhutongyuii]QBH95717.1 adenosylmethionine--8-amino-7-oxononanoate transaminase [Limnobaculum zhutongyuii]TQS86518.1 adenosylmethionine--8-amino-7-oxononanoate transaminase [Limnobaculum zhutongyuii]
MFSDIQFDQRHIWHPYTSMIQPLPCYPVSSAQGASLFLQNGSELVDGMSSWWAAIHGYNHPILNQAVSQQLVKMAHVMFGGITHQPAIELCRRLIEITEPELETVFLADSGSVAVEVAMKMALQYWQSKGEQRHQFLALRHGYHGDTFGAMSVCDPHNSMHSLYQGFLPQNLFADRLDIPFSGEWQEGAMDSFSRLMEQHQQDIAAVILEPIVQGAGGMRFYHPEYLKRIRQLCDQYQILMITDEIATGFGRTGKLFACQHAGISPDIQCVGKALTGGYMTLSAVMTTRNVAEVISQGEAGCFMHGPTFMANPLACAVACASLDLLAENHWQSQVSQIADVLEQGLRPLEDSPYVQQVRVLGAIGVVEVTKPIDMASLQKFFVAQGVWIRPFGKLIYLMPPYIIQPEQLSLLIEAIRHAVSRPDILFG